MKLRGYGREESRPDPVTGSTSGESPALAVEGLHFAYPGQPPVLNGVDFTLQPGERAGLIGANGTGKTSIFLLVSGLLKPDSGAIALFGDPVRKGSFHPEIGLVFQNPSDQLFSPSVRDDIAFGPLNMGLPAEEISARVAQALHITGTQALADRPPHHLSGGEKRMVSIASVLAMQPRLLLFDEPDANLDIQARRRLIRFLQTAPQTLLVASHDLELILEVCDRVLLLDGGRVVADGAPAQVMGDEGLMAAHGLEKPHSLIPHLHPVS
ncbi:MAG: ABC transporter ATP-binding protein [Anaerolineae bacterium]|nr:ABC transporter ATP-binding protein [Anaerolineae bacterium]